MKENIIPNKLKDELEDVKKVYDFGKTICTHPNSFDRLQTEIVKVCNVNKELEKENAELKERIKSEHEIEARKNNSLISQLIEAKKIIGNLYSICKDNHYPNSSVLMEQAEQFLKE